MTKKLKMAVMAALVCGPAMVPPAAMAQHVYHGRHHYYHHHHYRHRCRGGNGAVGTIAGGVGGAVIGNAAGGTAGTVIGGVGGALLGRHLDKQNTRHRRGC